MKLRKAKWQNHPSLGNLELDFTRVDGTAYDTVVLIGENGSGKTSVMESIGTFLNVGSFDPFEYLEFEVDGGIYRVLHRDETYGGNNTFFRLQDMASGGIANIHVDRYNNSQELENNTKDPRHYGCVISKARANYRTDKIKHTTTSHLDSSKYSNDNDDNFTSLKQMFVDIVSQDEHDYTVINEGKSQADTITVEQFRSDHSKQYRFVHAFDAFFADRGLKYCEVENQGDNKEIFFKRGGSKIEIDSLSTGEKQIVYRGMFLLRNLNMLSGGIVFVDEPELSMHPRWQKKILSFYEDLFRDKLGRRMVQMFVATHSNYVVDSAFTDADNHLVLLLSSDNNGVVTCHKVANADRVLPRISTSEINYLAFHLPSIEYHTELYGHLQIQAGNLSRGRTFSVKEMDDYIKGQQLYNPRIHAKQYKFERSANDSTTYDTLCSYIRNCIDHPDPSKHTPPTESELETSIELLRELCRSITNSGAQSTGGAGEVQR